MLPVANHKLREGQCKSVLRRGEDGQELLPQSRSETMESWMSEWKTIDTAPMDVVILLAWEDSFLRRWEYEAGMYGSTRGGWRHGQATHWMPLPEPPK